MGKIKIKHLDDRTELLINRSQNKMKTEHLNFLCEIGKEKDIHVRVVLEMEQHSFRMFCFEPDDLSDRTSPILVQKLEKSLEKHMVIKRWYKEMKRAYELGFGFPHVLK